MTEQPKLRFKEVAGVPPLTLKGRTIINLSSTQMEQTFYEATFFIRRGVSFITEQSESIDVIKPEELFLTVDNKFVVRPDMSMKTVFECYNKGGILNVYYSRELSFG